MKKSILLAGLVTLVLSLSTIAQAKKPKMCADWLPYATTRTDVKDAPKVVVCFDSKKPTLIVNPYFVVGKDAHGNEIRIAVENE